MHPGVTADTNGMPKLILKTRIGDQKRVQKLLNSGADFMATDNDGLSALHYASWFCHIYVVQLLLQQDGSKDLLFIPTTSRSKCTCLHLACILDLASLQCKCARCGIVEATGARSSCKNAKDTNLEIVKALAQAGGERPAILACTLPQQKRM